MHAVVEVGSLQFKVAQGDVIDVQLIDKEEKSEVTLDKVLMLIDGDTIKVGQPYLSNVRVSAQILNQHLADKVLSFKYQRRKNNNWRKGHRQKLTTLSITKISAGS